MGRNRGRVAQASRRCYCILVLETDEVRVDVRSPFADTLIKQLADVDDSVLVGAPLFEVIKDDGATVAATVAYTTPSSPRLSAAAPVPASGEPELVNVPPMGDWIFEGTIVSWLKSVGEVVAQGDVVVVIETDKDPVNVRAPRAGIIQEVFANVDEVVAIGAPLFRLVPSAPVTAVRGSWSLRSWF